ITVIDELSTWYPPAEAVDDLLIHMGHYTHALVARWTPQRPIAAASAWLDPNTLPANTIDRFHERGVRVLVSAAGLQASSDLDPREYAGALARFVRSNDFDGVSLATDDRASASSPAMLSEWLYAATDVLRHLLPADALIAHEAPASAFSPATDAPYLQVHERAGEHIDFYVLRYFGEDSSDALDFDSLFVEAPPSRAGTALDELREAGLDPAKLVVGLPVTGGPGRSDHVELGELATMVRRRIESSEPLAGVCGWNWASDRKLFGGAWSKTLARALGARDI
ncbi:MAG TPA: hypothetical protein VM869_35275, partial [Enhygromyxa sp.]|nr:hypothetical protein [Enhygromyxa sp.]